MMLLATALFAAQASPMPPPTETTTEDEIVVVARRLDGVAVHVGRGPGGKWYCGMGGSSGVASLDRQLCKAVTNCVRKGALGKPEIDACVRQSKRRLLEEFTKQFRKNR